MWGNPLKPKKYTPETLWEGALEYFNWCDENPWRKKEPIKSGEMAGEVMDVPTSRPYTKQGLIVSLNISLQTYLNYSSAEGYETYFEVCKHINAVIEQNQLEGASVNAYNPQIIARLLGLVDKKDLTTDGEKIAPKNVMIFGGKEIEI